MLLGSVVLSSPTSLVSEAENALSTVATPRVLFLPFFSCVVSHRPSLADVLKRLQLC